MQKTNPIRMQARRQDIVTGGHKQILEWHKKFTHSNSREWTNKQRSLLQMFTNSGVKTKPKKKKKGFHLKKYANINDFWGETTKK